MQNSKFKIIIFFLVLFNLLYVSGSYGKGPGSSSFEFLNIPVGARESGMASGTAVAHGPNAYWWNPAGLCYIERKSLTFLYNQWLEGITQQRLGLSFPMKKQAFGAINISMLSIQGIEGYTWHDVPTGEITSRDLYFSYTQAKRFKDYIMAGLTLKSILEELDDISAYAVAADLGILLKPFEGLWISAGVRNLGVSGKFIELTESLPTTFFSGFGMQVNKLILISSDFLYLDNEFKYGAGLEFNIWRLLFLRAGWNNIADVDEAFSLGAGWNWHNISLDYAYAPYGKLGNTSRFDLNIRFGKLPLIEKIYRTARKLYKSKAYDQALIEFSKINSLSPDYKKVKIWLEKTRNQIELNAKAEKKSKD